MFDFFRVTPKKRSVKIRGNKGIIYSNPPIYKKTIFYIGTYFIIFSLIFLGYLYWPLGSAIVNYKLSNNKEEKNQENIQYKLTEKEKNVINPEETVFSIQIPKILAASRIVAGVSPFNPNEYLKVLSDDVVAQAKDSASPGSGKGSTTFIFAHSTRQGLNMVRKNSVFYLLGELIRGDVVFVNYKGKIYTYRVYTKKIVNASEIEYLNYKEEERELLILQTCWPIGTDWRRLLVFAERIK